MTEHVDVLIVGAGISGIGAAFHLKDQCPDKSFAIVEAMDGIGGTWKTHTYPGVRSDSDLYTFGYRFKPWTGAPIATGEEIMRYLSEVVAENDLEPAIRFEHRLASVSWDSASARWTIIGTNPDGPFTMTAGFLWMCQGYYRHDTGYTPAWDGFSDFGGEVIHPQQWRDDVDLSNKRIVVIGSGATAATLIPNLVKPGDPNAAAHVTMLQRSPTFFAVRPNRNELADHLRSLDIPEEWTHEIVRRSILQEQHVITEFSAQEPELVREELYKGIREIMGDDFDVAPHFTPSYRPWQQRLALVPDGDLFHAIKAGRADVVTDTIDHFTESGIRLSSGGELEADVVITATGFDLSVLGDIDVTVDGESVDLTDTVSYRGTMLSGVPNMSMVFGYFRASWTLRVDLLADFVCGLLHNMDKRGATAVVPTLSDDERTAPRLPWVDPEDFNPGYMQRKVHLMPKRLANPPWTTPLDYWKEVTVLPHVDLDEPALRYS